MNPNNVNHFSSAAVGVDRARSTFSRPQKILTTMKAGRLIPLTWDEVLPGDNYLTKLSGVVRQITPVFPTMDNSYLDIYAFYVPNRIIWAHWPEFMGENNSVLDAWTPDTTYQVPQLVISNATRNANTTNKNIKEDLLSYLGIPLSNSTSGTTRVSALPVRAYCKIWNDFFRDENLQTPLNTFYNSDSNQNYNYLPDNMDYNALYPTTVIYGGLTAPVDKFKDYFTSALPAPQRGEAVGISLGELAPVITLAQTIDSSLNKSALQLKPLSGGFSGTGWGTLGYQMTEAASGGTARLRGVTGSASSTSEPTPNGLLAPVNLFADLSNTATINQLRMAIATQQYTEILARSGSRYIELLYSLFGVKSSDARLQRAEYLGGKRIPLNMTQVNNTNGADGSVLGSTAGYSLTGFSENLSNHFFEEHGIFMVLGAIRTDNTYAQGIERQWTRKTRYDYYAPVFANLGEQPIYQKEIYYTGSNSDDDVFGYQEAWAEYRYKPNIATGYFNPNLSDSIASFSYINNFSAAPTLNAAFIRFDENRVGQTLAVTDTPYQYICDFYLENKTTRVMPMYSVPGLDKV